MDSICTSSRADAVACNEVYTPFVQYVKYKLYLFEGIDLIAILKVASGRSNYWLRIGSRDSSKAPEGGWSSSSGGRGAPSRSSPGHLVLRTTASARISPSSSAMHCAAARYGTPWQRRRQAGIRVRADIGGRRPVPEGLRTRARPAPGCPGRAARARGIGCATEVGRSAPGGRQDRTERRHERAARGGRRRAQRVGRSCGAWSARWHSRHSGLQLSTGRLDAGSPRSMPHGRSVGSRGSGRAGLRALRL
jgi:hypothetical protein